MVFLHSSPVVTTIQGEMCDTAVQPEMVFPYSSSVVTTVQGEMFGTAVQREMVSYAAVQL